MIAQITVLAVVMRGIVMREIPPAQCSKIILTTITDVMGFLAFLGFAALFRGYLM